MFVQCHSSTSGKPITAGIAFIPTLVVEYFTVFAVILITSSHLSAPGASLVLVDIARCTCRHFDCSESLPKGNSCLGE